MAITKEQTKQGQNGHYCEYGYWHSSEYNAETLAALEEAERIIDDPKSKSFDSVAELMADLMPDDDNDET